MIEDLHNKLNKVLSRQETILRLIREAQPSAPQQEKPQ